MTPLVSVIIPCYNAEPWLAETLDSALAQTWPRCEIIVVDDESSDRSLDIAKTYEIKGVKVLSQPKAGAAAARNAGLGHARGDYLQFLDADDLLAPDKIATQVRRLEESGNDCLISCGWQRFTHTPTTGITETNQVLWRDLPPVEWWVLAAEQNLMMATASWLLPRRIADRIGGWNTDFVSNPIDDMEYFDRARAASRMVWFCEGTFAYYRSGLNHSLSQARSETAWRAKSATLHRSADLLFELENSPRTRHAMATMLQGFIYELYPHLPDLLVTAADRVQKLGGSNLPPPFGPARRQLARLIGWKLTKRLHSWIHQG